MPCFKRAADWGDGPQRTQRFSLVALGLTLAVAIAGSSAPAQEQKVDAAATREYAVAVGLQGKKLYPQAAARWLKFIQAYPTDARLDRAHHYLGACQLQTGEFDKAVATFKHVLATFPQFASRDAAQYNLALAMYNMAQTTKKPEELRAAADQFAAVPANYPQSKQAAAGLYYQAECLYLAGDAAAASPIYQKLIATYPQSELLPEARYNLGAAQQELGLDEPAVATFQSFLAAHAAHPQMPECKLRLGLSLLKLKKFAEAAQSLEQAAAVPMFVHADLALLRQAQCLYEQQQLDPAVALYQSLPTKFPQTKLAGAALLAGGKCLFQAEKFQPAQATLTSAVQTNTPESAEASYWLGKTLIKLNQAPAALAEMDRAVQAYLQSPQLPQLKLGRIDALYEMPDRRKETVPLYLEFAQQNPDHELAPQASYMAALSALSQGDYVAAQAHAATFLANAKYAMHALTPEVLFVSAESLVLATGPGDVPPELAKAEPVYRQLLTQYPEHRHVPMSRVRIGLCLYLQKNYDGAVNELTQTLPTLKDLGLAAETHLLMGRAHHDAARLPQALAAFQESLRVKPDWPRADEVLLALADTFRRLDKLNEAAAELTRLHTNYPMSRYRDQALYQLGEISHDQQKYDDAATFYNMVVTQFPQGAVTPLAAFGIGRAQFAKLDFTAAVPALTAVVTNYPQHEIVPRARYVRGLAQQRLKQFQPALEDLQAFLAAKPPVEDALDARYAVALCQAGLLQYEPAAATLNAILAEAPTYPHTDKVLYELGFTLNELKQSPQAAEAWRQLATKLPDSPLAPESWFRVGEFHEEAKQWAEAGQAFTAGLQKAQAPELKEKLQFKLGWTQYQAEQFAPAVATFQAQLQMFPQGGLLPDATYLAGECLFRQDKLAEALPLFAQAIAQKSEQYLPRALYRAGASAAGLKQWPASEAHYMALVAQFPKFELVSEARYGQAWAMQNQEKLAQAKELYEQVTKETETETAAKSRFMIGECAFREKKFEEAVEHFLTAALGYPYEEWQAMGQFEAGRCFIELKDNAKAIEALETVVTKYPNHAKAKDAAALLATLKK